MSRLPTRPCSARTLRHFVNLDDRGAGSTVEAADPRAVGARRQRNDQRGVLRGRPAEREGADRRVRAAQPRHAGPIVVLAYSPPLLPSEVLMWLQPQPRWDAIDPNRSTLRRFRFRVQSRLTTDGIHQRPLPDRVSLWLRHRLPVVPPARPGLTLGAIRGPFAP